MSEAEATEGRLLADRYRLGGVLGKGGMGTVWRAVDETLGRTVAVKELRFPGNVDEDEKRRLVTRTLREAKATARIRNTGAVTVFDVVKVDDRPWIVMELIEGRSLSDLIREDGPLSPRRAAEVGLVVLDVLSAAHREGILHRDVKPSNVLIANDSRVVLSDFGIAQIDGDPSVTSTGMLVGAPSYISPERARGQKPGPPADLWSLGALLFAAVEGRPPYDKGTAIATLTAVMTEPVGPMPHAGPLAEAISGLLVKDPEQRIDEARARTLLQQVVSAPEGEATTVVRSGETRTQVLPETAAAAAPAVPAAPPADAPAPAVTAAAPAAGPAAEPGLERAREALRAVRKAAAAPAAGTPSAGSPSGGSPSGGALPPRRLLLIAVAVLVVLGVVIGIALASSGGGGSDDDGKKASSPPAAGSDAKEQGKGASAAPTTTVTASATATATAAKGADDDADSGPTPGVAPAGYHLVTAKDGAVVALPAGWKRLPDTSYAPGTYYAGPNGARLLVDYNHTPGKSALADWKHSAKNNNFTDYHEIQVKQVSYRGWDAADWEFRRKDSDGKQVHVLNRGFVTDPHHGYALMFTTPAATWQSAANREMRKVALATFKPAK